MLVAWLPALGLGWLTDHRVTRVMVVMFLTMYEVGAWSAARHHRQTGPLVLALLGGGLLLATTWHLAPRRVGWIAFLCLLSAWLWDRRLLLRASVSHHARHHPEAHR